MRLSTMICSVVRAVRSYFHREWDLETLLNVINYDRQLTPEIRRHLKQMYRAVVWILASFGFGFHLRLAGNIGGLVAGVGTCVCIVWFSKFGLLRQGIRFCVLITGAMFGGALVGPCFSSFFDAYLDFIVNALMGTFVTLGWLEAAQFYLFSFSTLLLSNPLEVEVFFLSTLVLTADPYLRSFQIYTWILWFVAYVAVYSRTLVRRIRHGDGDFVNHAITLFTDAPAVCLRMINLVFWGALRDIREKIADALENYLSRRDQ